MTLFMAVHQTNGGKLVAAPEVPPLAGSTLPPPPPPIIIPDPTRLYVAGAVAVLLIGGLFAAGISLLRPTQDNNALILGFFGIVMIMVTFFTQSITAQRTTNAIAQTAVVTQDTNVISRESHGLLNSQTELVIKYLETIAKAEGVAIGVEQGKAEAVATIEGKAVAVADAMAKVQADADAATLVTKRAIESEAALSAARAEGVASVQPAAAAPETATAQMVSAVTQAAEDVTASIKADTTAIKADTGDIKAAVTDEPTP